MLVISKVKCNVFRRNKLGIYANFLSQKNKKHSFINVTGIKALEVCVRTNMFRMWTVEPVAKPKDV